MDQLSAHLDRGWDLVARGDFAGALVSAQKSLELDSDSPEVHNLLGYIHAAEGDPERALEHYRQAVDLDETFVEAMLNAAEILIHPVGDFEQAIQLVDDALDYCANDDEIADATLIKIDALIHQGKRDEAATILGNLPEGPFENPHINLHIGRALFELGQNEQAAPRIKAAVEQDGKNAEAHYYHGLVLETVGDRCGATVALLTSRELDLETPDPPWSIPSDQFEARVQVSLRNLPDRLRKPLDGALVVVGDVPGAEVVAEGVDPRASILLEGPSPEEGEPKVERVFVYQRNVERAVSGVEEIVEEIAQSLEHELVHLFPSLAPAEDEAGHAHAHAHGAPPEPPTPPSSGDGEGEG